MAENQLWLHVATTLQCFNIDPAVDGNGMPVIPPRTYTSGMASRPLPFTCKLTPRSAAYASLIEQNIAYQE